MSEQSWFERLIRAILGSDRGSAPVALSSAPFATQSSTDTPNLGMCRLLTSADLRAVGLQPDLDQPTANLEDDGASAYCTYTRASGANGGIEFDIFESDDPVGTQQTILGEAEGNMAPASLANVDASFIGTAISGGPSFATIVVRKGRIVFTIAIPPDPEASDRLVTLANVVLQRLPAS
jgi:hypothetical protein